MVSTLKVNKIQIPNSDSDVISLDATTGNIAFNKPVTGTAMVKLLNASWTSTVAEYDITSSTLSSTYDNYFIMWRMQPTTDNITMYGRFSTDGGSSFRSDSGYYGYEFTNNGNSVSLGSNGATFIAMSYNNVGNQTGEFMSGWFYLKDIHNTTFQTTMWGALNWYTSNSALHGGGMYSGGQTLANRTDAVNGFRFAASSGDLANGEVTVYGLG